MNITGKLSLLGNLRTPWSRCGRRFSGLRLGSFGYGKKGITAIG